MSDRETILNHTAVLTAVQKAWSPLQKTAFRIIGTYVFLLCIPVEKEFYQALFHFKWHYLTLQSFSAFYPPKFIVIDSIDGVWGFLSYSNLIAVLLLSVLIGGIWTLLDRNRQNYSKLYYWLRVVVRYRFAYAMVSWGSKKVFVHQMIVPTIGVLHTNFGDLAEKKLYWQHVGIQPSYEVFLGFAELIPGLLLLHRKTAFIGAFIATIVCLNICIANHVYDGGVAVPAAYYTIIGTFLVWYELPYLWKLFILKEEVVPIYYYPSFSKPWQRYTRTGLKIAGNTVFAVVAPFLWFYGWLGERDNYNIPTQPGLADSKGYYQVTSFRLNGEAIPYSPLDSIRWHDATFEKWSSFSYSTHRPLSVDRMKVYKPHGKIRDMAVTRFEQGGLAGGRRFFYYEADTVNHVLTLQNKNPNHPEEKMLLTYARPTQDRMILKGRDEFNDSIEVVLDRLPQRYQLEKSMEKD